MRVPATCIDAQALEARNVSSAPAAVVEQVRGRTHYRSTSACFAGMESADRPRAVRWGLLNNSFVLAALFAARQPSWSGAFSTMGPSCPGLSGSLPGVAPVTIIGQRHIICGMSVLEARLCDRRHVLLAAADTAVMDDGMMSTAIGARIRSMRQAAGLTQQELADRIGTSQPAVARLESGRCAATVNTLVKVSQALDCQLSIVFAKKCVLPEGVQG